MSVDVMREIESYNRARAELKASQPVLKLTRRFLEGDLKQLFKELNWKIRSVFPLYVGDTMRDEIDALVKDTRIPDGHLPTAAKHLIDRRFHEWKEHNAAITEALSSVRRKLRAESDPFAGDESAITRFMLELQIVGAPKTKAEVLKAVRDAANGSDLGAVRFWNRNAQKLFDSAEGKASAVEFRDAVALIDEGIHMTRDSKQKAAHERLTQLESQLPELEQNLFTARHCSKTIVPEPRERTEQETRLGDLRWHAAHFEHSRSRGDEPFDEEAIVRRLVDEHIENPGADHSITNNEQVDGSWWKRHRPDQENK